MPITILHNPRCSKSRQTLELLIKQGIKINPSFICRTKEEFENAGKLFADCSAVVCLHLAYSPSLESVDMLESLNKPLIMLDTTMGESFGTEATGEDLMNNHGIHGLQDLCSVLKRRKVKYFVYYLFTVIANKNKFKCSFSVLNFCKLFCKTCVSLGHLASKINSNFHAFQIEIVFPSCRPFQSEL